MSGLDVITDLEKAGYALRPDGDSFLMSEPKDRNNPLRDFRVNDLSSAAAAAEASELLRLKLGVPVKTFFRRPTDY